MTNLYNAAVIEHIHMNLTGRKTRDYASRKDKFSTTYTLTRKTMRELEGRRDKLSGDTKQPSDLTDRSSIKLEIIPPDSNADRDTTSHYDPWWTLGLMTTEENHLSEMSVVQLIGGSVRSTFVIPECKVMR